MGSLYLNFILQIAEYIAANQTGFPPLHCKMQQFIRESVTAHKAQTEQEAAIKSLPLRGPPPLSVSMKHLWKHGFVENCGVSQSNGASPHNYCEDDFLLDAIQENTAAS